VTEMLVVVMDRNADERKTRRSDGGGARTVCFEPLSTTLGTGWLFVLFTLIIGSSRRASLELDEIETERANSKNSLVCCGLAVLLLLLHE
jgi:hypothetical protein